MSFFLLDTNAVIAFLNAPLTSPVSERCRQVGFDKLVLSSVVLQELFFGSFKSGAVRMERNLKAINQLHWHDAAFERGDAEATGRIRAELTRSGKVIGPYDVMIAGQALARGWTVITNNTREFERVPGLNCEDWTLPTL